MKRMVYADHAATTQLDMDAFEAMKPYLLNQYGNPSQPYTSARCVRQALEKARAAIAACIHATPEEIFFTSGGTESNNWAIKGVAFAAKEPGATVTCAFEHASVLSACHTIEKMGYPVAYVHPGKNGIVHPHTLAAAIPPATRLVSVMMANNEIGTLQPIRDLAALAHSRGALLHTDAVACMGRIPVDVQALGVDLLSASAHKFNGPKGVGFLYVKNGTPIAPLMDGGAQEKGMRAGTENVAAIVGMAAALEKNQRRLAENSAYVSGLEQMLLQQLTEAGIPYIRNGRGETVPGTMSLAFPGWEGETLLHRLDILGIQVSTGAACDGASTRISHVLQAIELDEATARSTIRISLGADNTPEDVSAIATGLKDIIRYI